MIKFLQSVYVPTLAGLTGQALSDAQFQEAKALDQMSGPELLSLHNLVASNLGKGATKRFSDSEAARRRTWAVLQEYDKGGDQSAPSTPAPAPKPDAPKPAADRKKRGMRFVFPAESEIKPVRAESARGKALAVLSRKGGGTFEDVQRATGWSEKAAYEGIRLLHYYSGYGLAEEVRDGKTFITVHTGKK